jgi:GTP-binding protein EngB required for normal cell division
MISSPEKFNNISKLFLIKKKLVKKSNEVLDLKKIFYEKNTLYRYLNQIYLRRQKLIEKMDKCSMLKDQLMKQKKLRNEMTLNKDEYDSRTEKSITNLFRH